MIKEPDYTYTSKYELNLKYCDIHYKHGRTGIMQELPHKLAHYDIKC